MAINVTNSLIITEQRSLIKNPIFLLCISFIFFFTYTILVEIFWKYGLTKRSTFGFNVYIILEYVNLITNLVYALAILWMPRKQKFILRS